MLMISLVMSHKGIPPNKHAVQLLFDYWDLDIRRCNRLPAQQLVRRRRYA